MARSRTRSRVTRKTARTHPTGILKLSGQGFGFVQTSEGEFFVPATKILDAFDGDLVEVSLLPTHARYGGHFGQDDKPAARVVRVIERAHEFVVGRYEIAEPFGVVVPEDPLIRHDIFTLHRENPDVREGDIVRVRMTSYPSRYGPAEGVVEAVLGHEGDPGIDIDLIAARHKLPLAFPEQALADVARAQVRADEALDQEGYRDLSGRMTFTIDPDDAKDYDDALSIEAVEGGVRLGVHIADVSAYVPWGSAVDMEARRRATSVYLVDRVIPMLPEKLSCDVCSLRPHEPRRTMSVDMVFGPKGAIEQVDIYPAVIESRARLTYGQAQACLDAFGAHDEAGAAAALRDSAGEDAPEVARAIKRLDELAKRLHDQRLRRGGMDFESQEAKVRLDDGGCPVGVDVRVKTDATQLVEEAMICANEAVARFLYERGVKSIYRTHEPPAPADLKELKPILQEFGYDRFVSLEAFCAGDPFAIQRVLAHAKGRGEEYLVSSLVIRSMKRASYKDACEPHFGLASEAYAHFTSPIRRYPDLMVHRMVRVALFGRAGDTSALESKMGRIAEHASAQERVADEAARDSQEFKLLQLLEQRVGQEESGIISGVTAQGFFVRLEDTAEGFVALRGAGEYFALDAARRTLTGSDTGATFRLGMKVRIRVAAVYPYEHRAEFTLLGVRM